MKSKTALMIGVSAIALSGCNIGDEFLPSGAMYSASVRTFFQSMDGMKWDNDEFTCEGGKIYTRDADRLPVGSAIIDPSGVEIECSPDLTWDIIAIKV